MSKGKADGAPETYTPGPWRVSSTGYSIKSTSDDMPIVASNPWGSGMSATNKIRAWLANADLIAAAPDLLEACEVALVELVEPSVDLKPTIIGVLRTAISKAKGAP